MHSDGLTKKGVLYARIKLPKGYLNVFSTHTQASYVEAKLEDEIPSYVMRLKHLVTAKNFIYKMLDKYSLSTDLNLFMGDLNVNATSKTYPIKEVMAYFSDDLHKMPDFQPITNNEYDLLMYIFNHSKNNYILRDTLYEEHKLFKVTYGDCHFKDEETIVPAVD